ncbi:MAG: DUF4349 domain-containing protein [Acidobacteriota bacterium]
MKCETIIEDLQAFLDNDLLAARQNEITLHLRECGECKQLIVDLQNVTGLLQNWEAPTPNLPAGRQLLAQAQPKRGLLQRVFYWIYELPLSTKIPIFVSAVAAIVFMVLINGNQLAYRYAPSSPQPAAFSYNTEDAQKPLSSNEVAHDADASADDRSLAKSPAETKALKEQVSTSGDGVAERTDQVAPVASSVQPNYPSTTRAPSSREPNQPEGVARGIVGIGAGGRAGEITTAPSAAEVDTTAGKRSEEKEEARERTKPTSPADNPTVAAEKPLATLPLPKRDNSAAIAPEPPPSKRVAGALRSAEQFIVKTAQLTVQTDNFDDAKERVMELVHTFNGSIVDQQVAKQEGGRIAYISIKVPKDKFDQCFSGLSGLGAVIQRSTDEDNLTERYYELVDELAAANDQKDEAIAKSQPNASRKQRSQREREREIIREKVKFATIKFNLKELSRND